MRLSTQVVVGVGCAVSAVSAVTLPRGLKDASQETKILPGAYIVNFESTHISTDSFFQNLSANGISATSRQNFDPSIYAGTSFHLHNASDSDLDTISNFTQVKSITPVRLHKRAAPAQRDQTVRLWDKAEAFLKKRSLTESNDTMTTHKMTGVDKLQKEGFDGTGITIGIIDTGVDYTLPALGGGYGPGYKIAYGYDLVGNYDDLGNPVPDDDPMDCLGHGTHVAGIIGASNDPYVLGVAPNATLHMYKVFGCADYAPTDILIQAFIMAHNNGVDLITSSIGGANGWPEEPWSAATAAIVAAGTPCMLAAGNDGQYGMFYASSASSGTDVTSVGSVDNTNSPTVQTVSDYTVDSGSPVSFGYSLGTGNFSNVNLPIWADTFDTTVIDDGCSGFTANVTGKIALIRRGTCTFDEKVASAYAAGANYVVIYNNVDGVLTPSVTNTDISGAAMVTKAVGEQWIKLLAGGNVVEIHFSTNPILAVDTPGPVNTLTGGTMSSYSSFGLTYENTIKPVISAPGGSILSTYLASEGGYAVESGTSMATPYVAGVVALFMQAKGKGLRPQEINNALAATAKPLDFNDGTSTAPYLASIAQQGGGLVDAYHLIHAGISLTRSNIPLNDTANFIDHPEFYIVNSGNTTMSYDLSHEPAGTIYTFDSNYAIDYDYSPALFPPPMDQLYSDVTISPSTLSIAPGAKERVTITVTPNPALNSTLVPVYSGYIKVAAASSLGESVRIPYAGVATKMNDILIADPTLNIFDNEYAVGTKAYSGPGASNGTIDVFQPSTYNYPYVIWNNNFGTKSARMDIVAVNGSNPVYTLGLATVGSLSNYPVTYISRGLPGYAYPTLFDGSLSDGTLVPSGVYKMVLRIAKTFGDLSNSRDYESYTSPPFYMDMS
ncbi:putative subtilisin-like protease [Coleophoma crateriformis]|uniref:Putative subtilisin-like protease n=1 Tax=Coleophoma crateriformis TaxID=565419 RepID=A0A3D8RQ18_9HELO|nr:putative subtilisin-like protease [Coleophoma crateriformis]